MQELGLEKKVATEENKENEKDTVNVLGDEVTDTKPPTESDSSFNRCLKVMERMIV